MLLQQQVAVDVEAVGHVLGEVEAAELRQQRRDDHSRIFSTTASIILADVVRRPGSSAVIRFCWVTMRMADFDRPAAISLARGHLAHEFAETCRRPPSRSVAIRATGPLRNVLNITPMPITSIICSQMPR